jgi:pimeloyl-ACP methyl ester carboxylesterase
MIPLRVRPTTSLEGRRILTSICFLLILFGCGGCAAHLATVETKPAHLPTTVDHEASLDVATKHLVAAKRQPPLCALGYDLSAASISYGVLGRRPADESARTIYNSAVARTVQITEQAQLQPWRRPIKVETKDREYLFVSPRPTDPDHDPSRYDLIPVDTLKIGGRAFKTPHPSVRGIGAPLVAVERSETPDFRREHLLRHIYAPVTAVIRFSGRKAQLDFIDPLESERIVLQKHLFPLAADFSAAIAVLIARDRPERLGFSRLMNPDAYADTTQLRMLQGFDPDRTPVIFVHGLEETPADWAPMVNTLRNDRWIREHYQFWFFTYPSGYPFPYSAELFRRRLVDMKRAYPKMKRAVLVGHSMGGMICQLMITDAGDKIWRSYFGTPPAQTLLMAQARRQLEEVFIFNHCPEISRVIFISTPHRGSPLATSWIGRIAASLIKQPQSFTSLYAGVKPLLVHDPAAAPFNRIPNSVDTLEPNDRFLRALNKIPLAPGIPYHSIMGNRGRGDTPNSSDGIVPYWSSHLAGAQSELVVHSGHMAQCNPDAIAEVDRILKINLGYRAARARSALVRHAQSADWADRRIQRDVADQLKEDFQRNLTSKSTNHEQPEGG